MSPLYAIEVNARTGWRVGTGLNDGLALYADLTEALTDADAYRTMGYEVRVREYDPGCVRS